MTTPSQKRRDKWVELFQTLLKAGVPRHLRPYIKTAIKEINDASLYSRTAVLEKAIEDYRDQLPAGFLERLERFAPPPPYGPVVGAETTHQG